MNRKRFVQILILILLVFLIFSGVYFISRDNTTRIVFWHSYTGVQSARLQELANAYNESEGKKRNVEIMLYFKDEREVLARYLNEYETSKLPNIMYATAESAYTAYLKGRIVNAEKYLGESEMNHYVDGFLDSGRFTAATGVYLFPLTANLDVVYVNGTLLERYAEACGNAESDIFTSWDSLFDAAEKYYEWTDSLTEDYEYDGRAFLAVDDLQNYIMTVANQHAASVIQAGHKGIKIILNNEVMRNIWDFYYSGAVRGYISLLDDSVNHQMENGNVVCYIASSADAKYVPKEYSDILTAKTAVSLYVKPFPNINLQRTVVPQNTEGVVVIDHGNAQNEEAYRFLNWISSNKDMYKFCAEGNSMPVARDTLTDENVRRSLVNYISENNASDSIAAVYNEAFYEASTYETYSAVAFNGSAAFKKELAESLRRVALNAKDEVDRMVEEGVHYEEAIERIDNDKAFESWFETLRNIAARY